MATGFSSASVIMAAGSSKLESWPVGKEEQMRAKRFVKFAGEIQAMQKSVMCKTIKRREWKEYDITLYFKIIQNFCHSRIIDQQIEKKTSKRNYKVYLKFTVKLMFWSALELLLLKLTGHIDSMNSENLTFLKRISSSNLSVFTVSDLRLKKEFIFQDINRSYPLLYWLQP